MCVFISYSHGILLYYDRHYYEYIYNYRNKIDLVTHNEYLKTKHVNISWKQELCNQYTQSFNVKEIEQFQSKLTEMAHVTQQIVY